MLITTQVISKILYTKDFSIVKKNALTKDYFNPFSEEFEFIENHYETYGNVPDVATFLEKFPTFELIEGEIGETDSYLLEKLFEEYCYQKFVPVMQETQQILKDDSRQAYEYLNNNLLDLKPRTLCTGHDIVKEAQERYELYVTHNDNPEKAVIKTGLPELDDIFNGWEMGEELVTIVARINQGKSWLMMKLLVEAWKQGKRVGLYSGEMSHVKLGYRFDALFGHYSNRALSRGGQTENYKDYIANLINTEQGCFNIITQKEFRGRPTVPQLRHYIETNQLDILGVDQYSLVADARGSVRDTARVRFANITEDLFLASTEYKIPILGLAQANRASLDKDDENAAPGLENIKESDDIGANSSKALGMKQQKGCMVIDVIKNRGGKVGDKLNYVWDIDTGYFSYAPAAKDAVNPVIRQQAIQQQGAQQKAVIKMNPF